jgi:GDP-L-fucose synthase
MFAEHRPDVLVHLAAYSGGIVANRMHPADFYYRNTLLTAYGFELAARHGVRKLIYPIAGCSYPAAAHSPIDEAQMWTGAPHADSEGYAAAKKLGLVASRAYRAQHALASVVVVPGNMYGEWDNFRDTHAHVVAGMLRRFLEAKRTGAREIVMWGTGQPRRDFVYAGDVAACLPYFIETYDSSEPVNVSSGTETSIRELAETIREEVGFDGAIVWDTSRPDGQGVKVFDVGRLHALGLACETPLGAGLRRTYAWLQRHYDERSDGLRL